MRTKTDDSHENGVKRGIFLFVMSTDWRKDFALHFPTDIGPRFGSDYSHQGSSFKHSIPYRYLSKPKIILCFILISTPISVLLDDMYFNGPHPNYYTGMYWCIPMMLQPISLIHPVHYTHIYWLILVTTEHLCYLFPSVVIQQVSPSSSLRLLKRLNCLSMCCGNGASLIPGLPYWADHQGCITKLMAAVCQYAQLCFTHR